jgi:antagonist of KipI
MIKCLSSGLLSSIQDLGRYGYQKYGVIVSGVMDTLSHRLANILVGNDENAPTIEMTLLGSSIRFEEDVLISICGADLSATINGKAIHLHRPIYVKKGSVLSFGRCRVGCRAYLAVAGGFDVPSVMGSYSTYIRAGIGGYHGRALKAGDKLKIGKPSETAKSIMQTLSDDYAGKGFSETSWSVATELHATRKHQPVIRVMKGRQATWFSEKSFQMFLSESFEISPKSDRMGYRLVGPVLNVETSEDMLSEAVSFGTIQVPPDGQPIILLADRQTTGGYPKIGQVITADLPILAQLKPGEHLRFKEVTQHEALQFLLEFERNIQLLKTGISLKTRIGG